MTLSAIILISVRIKFFSVKKEMVYGATTLNLILAERERGLAKKIKTIPIV